MLEMCLCKSRAALLAIYAEHSGHAPARFQRPHDRGAEAPCSNIGALLEALIVTNWTDEKKGLAMIRDPAEHAIVKVQWTSDDIGRKSGAGCDVHRLPVVVDERERPACRTQAADDLVERILLQFMPFAAADDLAESIQVVHPRQANEAFR
jgi:hypothetical protein